MGDLLNTLSVYSVLLPLLTGLLLWKFQDANARIMVILLAFASVSQVIGSHSKDHKFIIYNSYIVVDVIFWSILLFKNTSAKSARMLITVLCFSFLVYASYTFYINGISKKFLPYLVCCDNIIQVICVLIYFFEKYYNEKFTRLMDDSMFWFCIGIFFYAPCTYFLFVYRSFYPKNYQLSMFHNILNTLLYLIITVGFLVRVKKVKTLLQWIWKHS